MKQGLFISKCAGALGQALDLEVLSRHYARLCSVRVVEDFAHACESARARAAGGTVVVTGSVHTVGSAMALLGIDPLGE